MFGSAVRLGSRLTAVWINAAALTLWCVATFTTNKDQAKGG